MQKADGSVASALSGARLCPTSPPSEITMAGLAPPNIAATARVRAFCLARASFDGMAAFRSEKRAGVETALDPGLPKDWEPRPFHRSPDDREGRARFLGLDQERIQSSFRHRAEDLVIVAAGQDPVEEGLHRRRRRRGQPPTAARARR